MMKAPRQDGCGRLGGVLFYFAVTVKSLFNQQASAPYDRMEEA